MFYQHAIGDICKKKTTKKQQQPYNTVSGGSLGSRKVTLTSKTSVIKKQPKKSIWQKSTGIACRNSIPAFAEIEFLENSWIDSTVTAVTG